MNPCVEEVFDDVRLMIARARRHQAEYEACVRADNWWSLDEGRKPNGAHTCTLVIHCQLLKELKPIAADLCNNLVHSLDQMMGALARLNKQDNPKNLYFPWKLEDEKFEKALATAQEYIGRDAAECIREARRKCHLALPVAHLAKDLSNSGKHWELVPSSGRVPAVIVHRPNGREVFNLPAQSLEEQLYYTFYEGPERLRQFPITAVLGLRLDGLSADSISPDAVFGSAFHYVEEVFKVVSESPAVEAAAEEHLGLA